MPSSGGPVRHYEVEVTVKFRINGAIAPYEAAAIAEQLTTVAPEREFPDFPVKVESGLITGLNVKDERR